MTQEMRDKIWRENWLAARLGNLRFSPAASPVTLSTSDAQPRPCNPEAAATLLLQQIGLGGGQSATRRHMSTLESTPEDIANGLLRSLGMGPKVPRRHFGLGAAPSRRRS
jgi:hypothetical protein